MKLFYKFVEFAKHTLLAFLLSVPSITHAFTGSDLTSGQRYYLFNIYQSKFLGADNKLQAPNIGTPLAFTASASGFTFGGTTYTATKNAAGYYQLKNGSNFFAFEDKVNDPNSPDDENRRMYLGGGVTCQNTTNDTDRSYWQLISETEYAEWQDKKKFTVASLNVDGMPKSITLNLLVYKNTFDLNPDATEGPGATAIGNCLKASGFDVVGVSEDFNYHSELWNAAWNDGQGVHYNSTTHVQTLSQNTANLTNYLSSKPLFTTDGQCLFYRDGNVDRDRLMNTETRVAWSDHNGYTDQGADGLITKGFRFYVVKLSDGTEIDLYSMHMDADDGQGDRDARASQLTQLANYIKDHNNGRPIVIIGDSNCRYTRDKVKSNLIDALNADANYTIRDPWIEFGRDSKYPIYPSGAIMASTNGYRQGEVVDKIWYVNNKQSNIRLVAETYHQDLSFVASEDVDGTSLKKGSPLCDHKPCVVTFSYHNYDSSIDDQPVNEGSEEVVFLRNRETGRFLKSGGSWGTHAVVGNYPLAFTMSEQDGKYVLADAAGSLFVDDNGNQPYVDGGTATKWTKEEVDGNFILLLKPDGSALTANDPFCFPNNPNYRWVITEPKNPSSKLQQWEVVSEEQMRSELTKANLQNPVNASWLLSNPNFDRNISVQGWGGQLSDATRMWSNLANGQNVGNNQDNFVAEVYVDKCSKTHLGSCDHGQTWDIHQTISNIPDGFYYATCQAFQRVSNNNSTTATIKFYGNSKEVDVQLMYSLKEVTEAGLGTKKDGNCYYPDNMSEASLYFNRGYYKHGIVVQVTDGHLTLGIKKTSNTGKDNTCWCCFDNFQIYYLGTEQPANDYNYEGLDVRHTAEFSESDTKLTLTGLWRVLDESELNNKVSDKTPLFIDATNATLIAKPTIPVTAGANTMIKVQDASSITNCQNVIDASDNCANLVLTDKKDFAPLDGFTANAIYYERTNTQGLNTVCLPFAIHASDFPETCTLYRFLEATDDVVRFVQVGEDEDVDPATPILIHDATSESGSQAKWLLNISAPRSVVSTVAGNTQEGQQQGLNGSFVDRLLGTGYYKLNSAGTQFVPTTEASTITPFRFYLLDPSPSAAKALQITSDEDVETGISTLLADPKTRVEETFDLSGRRVLTIKHPGIYVKGGKKIYSK